ncbi:hypothetical protein BU24DRAFT_396490 [Aaosphaeria arxii CBS 175.79]|uniref:Zn(2)-C6 fungal-type domain-containing protein n=1 Tax=Aaosphaeria arxii CBS 175.79 TaxID=1450172 RepID=A0A6A5XG09_9PLEO|nr:uncharacterized protein BU24DRAFT_396490 [Aaosphaeria arxii CBS 175.79]KAF2011863.1 hypothetical protein BU24DRAFT_396490 [Aaosphaeria arxii CBS 175.79]
MEARQRQIRKRVCKACDRCRLKKSKCSGMAPCNRCKTDDAICIFTRRRNHKDKSYPKGYVEILEQQQAQLVAGLRELYSRLQCGQGWPGPPLSKAESGHPLTHDILDRLDLPLPHSEHQNTHDSSEIDSLEAGSPESLCTVMKPELLESCAPSTEILRSISPDSDLGRPSSLRSSHSGIISERLLRDNNDHTTNKHPTMLPPYDLYDGSQEAPIISQELSMASSLALENEVLDPSTMEYAEWITHQVTKQELFDSRSQLVCTFDAFSGDFSVNDVV